MPKFRDETATADLPNLELDQKIHKWEKSQSAVQGKKITCPEYVRKLCLKLPREVDLLLAWLIDTTGYETRTDFMITFSSKRRAQLAEQILFQRLPRRDLEEALGRPFRFGP